MSGPRPRRPGYMSAYGVPEHEQGMLPWAWAEERLVPAHNYWVATSGPHASPVWGLWRNNAFVFSCSPTSRKARSLARDPHIVVHLEGGDDVVIVEGEAEQVAPTPELLAEYAAKYGPVDADIGNWYAVRPRRAFAWQEATFPNSPTRFDFES